MCTRTHTSSHQSTNLPVTNLPIHQSPIYRSTNLPSYQIEMRTPSGTKCACRLRDTTLVPRAGRGPSLRRPGVTHRGPSWLTGRPVNGGLPWQTTCSSVQPGFTCQAQKGTSVRCTPAGLTAPSSLRDPASLGPFPHLLSSVTADWCVYSVVDWILAQTRRLCQVRRSRDDGRGFDSCEHQGYDATDIRTKRRLT